LLGAALSWLLLLLLLLHGGSWGAAHHRSHFLQELLFGLDVDAELSAPKQ
jgi:hypothetical protein